MLVVNRENFTLNQLLNLKLRWEDELINTRKKLYSFSPYVRNSFLYDELIDLEFDLEYELELLEVDIKIKEKMENK